MFTAVCVLAATVLLLALTFSMYAYQKYLEREEIRLERADTAAERQEVGSLLVEVRNLLSAVKGWSVASKSQSERVAGEVKEEVKKVPDAAAQKTAQKVMDIIASGDSGHGLKRADLVPPAPREESP